MNENRWVSITKPEARTDANNPESDRKSEIKIHSGDPSPPVIPLGPKLFLFRVGTPFFRQGRRDKLIWIYT